MKEIEIDILNRIANALERYNVIVTLLNPHILNMRIEDGLIINKKKED